MTRRYINTLDTPLGQLNRVGINIDSTEVDISKYIKGTTLDLSTFSINTHIIFYIVFYNIITNNIFSIRLANILSLYNIKLILLGSDYSSIMKYTPLSKDKYCIDGHDVDIVIVPNLHSDIVNSPRTTEYMCLSINPGFQYNGLFGKYILLDYMFNPSNLIVNSPKCDDVCSGYIENSTKIYDYNLDYIYFSEYVK